MNQLVGIVDWSLFPEMTATIGFQHLVALLLGPTDEAVITAALPDANALQPARSARWERHGEPATSSS